MKQKTVLQLSDIFRLVKSNPSIELKIADEDWRNRKNHVYFNDQNCCTMNDIPVEYMDREVLRIASGLGGGLVIDLGD